MEIVATTSLPAVDRPNADRWNAARSRQNVKTAKKGDFVPQNSPLRKCFFFTFSPIHLVALSERFVLDPKF